MPLDLTGPSTTDALASAGEDAETAVEFEATELAATVEVSRTGKTYSLSGFVQWVKGKGFGYGVKGKKTF